MCSLGDLWLTDSPRWLTITCIWTLQWCNMSITVSRVMATHLFVQQLFKLTAKKTPTLSVTGPLWGVTTCGSPHKWPIMLEAFPFTMSSWSWTISRHDLDCLDGSVQEIRNSSASAIELCLSWMICQLALQPSCSDTCQTWIWYPIANLCFDYSKNCRKKEWQILIS